MRGGLIKLLVAVSIVLLGCAGWTVANRWHRISSGGRDARLAMSTLLRRSQLIEQPSLWSLNAMWRWKYGLSPHQRRVFLRSCDKRFTMPGECVVSFFADHSQGSYSTLVVNGDQAEITRSYMSFSDLEAMKLLKPSTH